MIESKLEVTNLIQNKETKKITLARLLDLPNSILAFCGISWFQEFKKHWESTGAIKLLGGRIKKTGTKSTIINFKKIHYHILLMGETEKLIQRQRNIILEKIEELYKGIEKDQNILDDILST
ncbi:hypothetical protein ACFE6N_22830 [Pedobacter sp. BG31]|uniref:hypothetical protein n=1 Tax=Pedobacter sp. BG31 TaxID=3349697 RepID=UPI0035F44A60